MSKLVAVDVALLMPPDVAARAIAFSAALPADDEEPLRLDASHLPHVTLTQQFVREEEITQVLERVDGILRGRPPLRVRCPGAGRSGHTISLEIERSDALIQLHEVLMEELRGLERPGGTPAAFFEGEGRLADVMWVAGFRLQSSFGEFRPHITLGHGEQPPPVEPFEFDARTAAVCHLGRFCTCRRILRQWTLTA